MEKVQTATFGQCQLITGATSDMTTEDSDFSTPSCTVVEGPKEHALLLRGREEVRVMKKTVDCELKETSLSKKHNNKGPHTYNFNKLN